MSIDCWIKGVHYSSSFDLNINWTKYKGSKADSALPGNGNSDGSGGSAKSLEDYGTSTFRVENYIMGKAYPALLYSSNATGYAWYPLASLPTAYVAINFEGVGTYTYTWVGTATSDQKSGSGKMGNFPSGPSKTGYTFKYWNITSGPGAGNYESKADVYSGWIANNFNQGTLTAKAVYIANQYAVKFSANGGSGAPSTQYKTYNSNLTLSKTIPEKSGYTFLGWSESSSATEATYSAGGTFSKNITSEITLYAVWKSNTTVTITYDANDDDGGTSVPDPQSGYVGTSVTIKNATGVKAPTSYTVTITFDKVEEGATISGESSKEVTKYVRYSFKEWNTTKSGNGESYSAGQAITLKEDMTLYAQYTPMITGTTSLPTCTLEQYVFQGWTKSLSDVSLVSDPYSPSSNETLYAVWANTGFAMFKIPVEINLSAGTKIRLVGTKGMVNDGIYTVANDTEPSDGQTIIYFNEDFIESMTQDATEFNLEIYGEGTYVPDFDYICASDNRLWGCSSKARMIYASALGDPEDFETFENTTLDAYQLAVATPGDFTGCCALNQTILFTKQHCIHKMMGSYPSEYALYTYNIDGVSEGNSGSLVNCGGTAVFLTEHGLSTYSGSSSGTLSTALGEGKLSNGTAAYNGEKYELSCIDTEGNPQMYILDMRYGVWTQMDYNGQVLSIVHMNDDDYVLVKEDNGNAIYCTTTGDAIDDEWEIEFKDFFETITGTYNSTTHIFEKKRYTRLFFRIELPEGSTFKAELKSDDGEWLTAGELEGSEDAVKVMVVSTPRVDKLKMRLSGTGKMTILAMTREFTVGSAR